MDIADFNAAGSTSSRLSRQPGGTSSSDCGPSSARWETDHMQRLKTGASIAFSAFEDCWYALRDSLDWGVWVLQAPYRWLHRRFPAPMSRETELLVMPLAWGVVTFCVTSVVVAMVFGVASFPLR